MANLIAPATVMILLWAFEIVPIEGETRPDPKNAQFVDAIITYVHPYAPLDTAHNFGYKWQSPGPIPLSTPATLRKGCSASTRGHAG